MHAKKNAIQIYLHAFWGGFILSFMYSIKNKPGRKKNIQKLINSLLKIKKTNYGAVSYF